MEDFGLESQPLYAYWLVTGCSVYVNNRYFVIKFGTTRIEYYKKDSNATTCDDPVGSYTFMGYLDPNTRKSEMQALIQACHQHVSREEIAAALQRLDAFEKN